MATSERTIEFLLDQLGAVRGVRARKMFGEYALYCGEKVVALVCDDQLFVKITAPGKALVGTRYAEGFAYPGASDEGARLAAPLRAAAPVYLLARRRLGGVWLPTLFVAAYFLIRSHGVREA